MRHVVASARSRRDVDRAMTMVEPPTRRSARGVEELHVGDVNHLDFAQRVDAADANIVKVDLHFAGLAEKSVRTSRLEPPRAEAAHSLIGTAPMPAAQLLDSDQVRTRARCRRRRLATASASAEDKQEHREKPTSKALGRVSTHRPSPPAFHAPVVKRGAEWLRTNPNMH